MTNKKLKILVGILTLLTLAAPLSASALEIPKNGNELAEIMGVNAYAYVVTDAETGEVLISKNADSLWIPASLTKLVTVLVVLDAKPKLTKTVTMSAQD